MGRGLIRVKLGLTFDGRRMRVSMGPQYSRVNLSGVHVARLHVVTEGRTLSRLIIYKVNFFLIFHSLAFLYVFTPATGQTPPLGVTDPQTSTSTSNKYMSHELWYWLAKLAHGY